MLFAVDIDGTIAKHEPGEKSLIRYLNRELGLGISASRLAEFRCSSLRVKENRTIIHGF